MLAALFQHRSAIKESLASLATQGMEDDEVTMANLLYNVDDQLGVPSPEMIIEAIKAMEHNRRKPISVLPVVNTQGEIEGLLRLHDLVQAGLA